MDGRGRTDFGCDQRDRIPRDEDEKQGDLEAAAMFGPPRAFFD